MLALTQCHAIKPVSCTSAQLALTTADGLGNWMPLNAGSRPTPRMPRRRNICGRTVLLPHDGEFYHRTFDHGTTGCLDGIAHCLFVVAFPSRNTTIPHFNAARSSHLLGKHATLGGVVQTIYAGFHGCSSPHDLQLEGGYLIYHPRFR